ncbi:MAG: ABC transporter substrate-binding protein [Candidatus Bipolaricaulaceae bacterium]
MRRKLILFLALVLVGTALLGLAKTKVTFWTTLIEPKRMQVQQEIAADFMAEHPDIEVEVVPVDENELPTRIAAAYAAGNLPDLVRVPLDYIAGWAEEGILDVEGATALLEEMGLDTFAAGALELAEVDGGFAGIPVDGWGQLLLYRRDLFEEYDLPRPDDWASILQAAMVLHNPPDLYGIEVGTDPNQVFTQQVFEHFALSNGARLVNEAGEIDLTTPGFVAALQYYKLLATEFTPPGNIYWLQTRADFQAGKAAMIVWSPYILDELAGLRDSVPVTAQFPSGTPPLHERVGIVTAIAGPDGEPAQYGYVLYTGITVDADVEAAQAFARYIVSDGYAKWLSMAPEGMFPMRPAYIDQWKRLEIGVDRRQPITELYPAEVIEAIASGVEKLDRWGFAAGKGPCISSIYGTKAVIDILRRYMDGEVATAAQAAQMIEDRVRALEGCGG